MKIRSEFGLIDKIRERVGKAGPPLPEELIMGIGDDAAVYRIPGGRYGIFTADISIESVHFILGMSTLRDIGYKAMAGNISDVAAMGGRPRLAFISLGIPEGMEEEDVLSIYDGMMDAARPTGTVIAGGDTSRSGELIVSIALYGEAETLPVLRSTAREGDRIYLTGSTGRSLAGLEVLKSGDRNLADEYRDLVERHLRPPGRADLTETIMREYGPTSMTDISDGLLSDLGHICTQSGRGFLLERERIPVADALDRYCRGMKRDPWRYVLESGEEYELIFTSPLAESRHREITRIGEITKEGFLLHTGEETVSINLKGYDHFKK